MISLVHDADQSKAKIAETATEETPAADATPPAAEKVEPASAQPAQTELPAQPETPKPVASEPATTASPFIPPKPVIEEKRPAPRAAAPRPDAFAEAAIANAAAQAERRRGRSLFQKVTGAVNRAMAEDQAGNTAKLEERREPVSDAQPAPMSEEPAVEAVAQPATATPTAPAPAEPTPAAVEPTVQVKPEPQPVATPVPAATAEPEPVAEPEPAVEPAAAPAPVERATSPAQPTLANIEPAATRETAREEEDMLEIPAFLRRQAN